MDENNRVTHFIRLLRRFVTMNIDYARLTAAEKVTILFSTAAFYAMAVILGTIFVVFLSIGIGHILSTTDIGGWAYLIVASFYLLLFVALVLLRRKLFINPICKFVTRILCKPPQDNEL